MNILLVDDEAPALRELADAVSAVLSESNKKASHWACLFVMLATFPMQSMAYGAHNRHRFSLKHPVPRIPPENDEDQ